MPFLRVAAVQFAPQFRDARENVSRVLSRFERAVEEGARLVLFPECALTGYCFASAEEAKAAALSAGGDEIVTLEAAARDAGAYLVVGFGERDGDAIYNSAAFLGPEGRIGVYRKTHLPFLGYDRFASKGSEIPIFDTPVGRFAILICYDIRFPEAALSVAKRGAEMILVPTNWPEGAESSPDLLVPARAWETHTFIAAANRVGEENGFAFIGKSGLWGVDAKPLAFAGHREEAILHGEVDLSLTREKRIVVRPGEYELDPFNDRRPEIYHLGPASQ